MSQSKSIRSHCHTGNFQVATKFSRERYSKTFPFCFAAYRTTLFYHFLELLGCIKNSLTLILHGFVVGPSTTCLLRISGVHQCGPISLGNAFPPVSGRCWRTALFVHRSDIRDVFARVPPEIRIFCCSCCCITHHEPIAS